MTELGKQFTRAMYAIYGSGKRDLGYNATRFLHMLQDDRNGVVTARRLLWSDAPSDGFTYLWQRHRLDLTVEAHILLPEYELLFSDDGRERARQRLDTRLE